MIPGCFFHPVAIVILVPESIIQRKFTLPGIPFSIYRIIAVPGCKGLGHVGSYSVSAFVPAGCNVDDVSDFVAVPYPRLVNEIDFADGFWVECQHFCLVYNDSVDTELYTSFVVDGGYAM